MSTKEPFTIEQFYKFLNNKSLWLENASNAEKSICPQDPYAITVSHKSSSGLAFLEKANCSLTQSSMLRHSNSKP